METHAPVDIERATSRRRTAARRRAYLSTVTTRRCDRSSSELCSGCVATASANARLLCDRELWVVVRFVSLRGETRHEKQRNPGLMRVNAQNGANEQNSHRQPRPIAGLRRPSPGGDLAFSVRFPLVSAGPILTLPIVLVTTVRPIHIHTVSER